MKRVIKFMLVPWRILLGITVMLYLFGFIFVWLLSIPYVFTLSIAIGWKILIGIVYIYLFSLYIVCIMNIDDVLYKAAELISFKF